MSESPGKENPSDALENLLDSPGGVESGAAPRVPVERSAFWLALVMAVVLIGCKLVHVGKPAEMHPREVWAWCLDVAVVSHADLVFCLVVGVAGGALLRLLSRWRSMQGAAWWCLAGFCTVSVAYGVVSVRAFDYLRMPLTYPLLYLAGDVKNMRSSVRSFADARIVLSLGCIPLAYLGVAGALSRRPPNRTRLASALFGVAAAGVVALAVWANAQVNGDWGAQHADRRLADNPHYTMLVSYVRRFIGEAPVTLRESFPEDCRQDFLAVRDRGPGGGSPTRGLQRGPRNVIIVIGESLGAQHMAIYGGKWPTAPRLASEAAHTVVFDNYYSHVTNTANSLVPILLSQYVPVSWHEVTVERPDFPGQTLAQVLGPRGYRSAFVTAGDNSYANQSAFLKDRGFDTVWDCRDSGASVPDEFSWGVEDRHLVDMILRWIDQDKSRPFCIVSWTQGTHHPYYAGPEHQEVDFFQGEKVHDDWDLGRYLNAMHELDRQLGRLFDALRQRGLADDTIVMVTGDHGEAFGFPHQSYGHSGKCYQEDVHVPFLIWSPALFKSGSRSATIGAHIDLAPTVLDLLNIALPESWQGHSLFDPARPQRAYFYGAMEYYTLGIREGNWKYIYNASLGTQELYDLAADRLEQNNVAKLQPDLSVQLRRRLAAWLDQESHIRVR